MLAIDLLRIAAPDLRPEDCKIHLATHNGREDPLDVYIGGQFEAWQALQTRKNFERPFVLALIQMSGKDQWLFAGLHRSCTPVWRGAYPPAGCYEYADMQEDQRCADLNGRLVVSFARPGRQAYLNAESYIDHVAVRQITSDRLHERPYPGHLEVNVAHNELVSIIRHGAPSWHGALSSVAGIYLILDTSREADSSGKLYVGMAPGSFWQRWQVYANTGHGNNVELMKVLKSDPSHARHFRYAILEIADTRTTPDDLKKREDHWIGVVGSRTFGLNANGPEVKRVVDSV